MTDGRLTAPKAANRLSKIMAAYSSAHMLDRFPVNVERLALQVHELFNWPDAIIEVKAANIPGFEGCLHPNDDRTRWQLLYNAEQKSPGRIRFTQAHELGHYILHRVGRGSMSCTEADMVTWSKDDENIEGQADRFASYLLMPLDDYKTQVPDNVDLDVFIGCARRYGVSLTAAILKWLDYTGQKALMVYSTDGFMNWSSSSEFAWKAGAFFRTKDRVVQVPVGSLAADKSVTRELAGRSVPASTWFPHAEKGVEVREMKLAAERLGAVITLVCLPSTATVWPQRSDAEI